MICTLNKNSKSSIAANSERARKSSEADAKKTSDVDTIAMCPSSRFDSWDIVGVALCERW